MKIEKRVLVVEDDFRSATVIKEVLEISGYKVTIADNGKLAFDVYLADPFPIIVSDLEMPLMGGKELVAKLREVENPPLVIIETAHNETDTVIDIMRLGVYDYLIKPIQLNELVIKVNRAFEFYETRQAKISLEKERYVRMQEEIDWLKWVEENSGNAGVNAKSKEQALFYNLKSSIVQGAGFGVLVSLLDMMSKSSKREGNNYLVNSELMEEVIKNNLVAKNIIKSFTDINRILNDEIKLEIVTVDKIYELINSEIQSLETYSSLKKQKIIIDQAKPRFNQFIVQINLDFFKKVVREIIINAMKFSPMEAKITMLLNTEEDKCLVVQIMNPAVEDNKKRIGIPMEYENLVFEPFFRMNQFLNSGFDTLDIGMGLTMVRHVIKKHNGDVSIFNIKDYREFSNSKFQVNIKLKLPVNLK